VSATIWIVGEHQPPIQYRFNDEDVVPSDSGHARSRRRSRELKPIGGQPEIPHRSPEHMHRGTAPAERSSRTACRMLHDRFSNMHGGALRVMVPCMMRVVPMCMVSVVMPGFGGRDGHDKQNQDGCEVPHAMSTYIIS
jgi:hypothetical protein